MQYVPTSFFGRRALSCVVLTAALAVGISACGSSSSTTSTAAAAGASGSTGSTARYEARLNLAKCFRAHGLNVPDPTAPGGTAGGGGGGGGGGGLFRVIRSYPQAQVQSAEQACSQYMKQAFAFANVSPAQQAQFRQAFVKYAECMRSHGINIPDPTTSGTGGFGFRGAFSSVDRNSPAFQSANQACASLRPHFGGGGGAGGGGAGG